eukprot:CAMPEP_0116004112 /NCGR_PEP_ID=MMETSP0321-20121206/420_1 /TAXON_ID=163516 /ORGANISM="Leptocylindrus danicus var. danicus, Strain B650" /LENGTH=189 /DNA_ID=CAMNT_0003472375 /DNA_START=886 /DNA_END=1455 /DNA_ORIENTATION=+
METANPLLRILVQIIVSVWNVLYFPLFLYEKCQFMRHDWQSMVTNVCALSPYNQVFICSGGGSGSWDCTNYRMLEAMVVDKRRLQRSSEDGVNATILRLNSCCFVGDHHMRVLHWQASLRVKYEKMIDEVLDRVASTDHHYGDPCNDDVWSDSDGDGNVSIDASGNQEEHHHVGIDYEGFECGHASLAA